LDAEVPQKRSRYSGLVSRLSAQGILFDLDGVVYNADQPIVGAAQALAWVREHHVPHLFLTNTTSRPRSALVEKLASFDIPATVDQILTPTVAFAQNIADQPDASLALFVRPATRCEFAGLPLLPEDADPHHHTTHVVIGDLGRHWDYPTLNRAFRHLYYNPASELVALGMTRYWLAPDGISLDVAPFVAALQMATGHTAVVFGKPATPFFAAAVRTLNIPADRLLLIGDDIQADVAGAQAFGIKGVLVKTGKYRGSDLAGSTHPDALLESIAELPARFAPEGH
jgi:HAD superfamily hydrolase (TIGR01458 family)